MFIEDKNISFRLTHIEKKPFMLKRDYKELKNRLSFNYTVVSGNGEPQNPFKLAVTLENKQREDYRGILRFELEHKKKGKIFMPAFMYGRNGGDRGQYSKKACYPHLTERGSKAPMSSYWQVRSDRLSHPIALACAEGCIFGISASPYYGSENGQKIFWENSAETDFSGFNGFYCSIKNGTCTGFTLGYENAPSTYILTPKYEKRTPMQNNMFEIKGNSKVEFPLYIYCYQAESEHDISKAIENCYNRYHQSPRKRSDFKDAADDIANAICSDAYVPDRKNYATIVWLKNGKLEQDINNISIGWTGGAEIAVPLLMAGIRLNNDSYCGQAIECIENIVNNSVNEKSGLPYDAYNSKNGWTEKGWWYSYLKIKGHNSYVIGQALFYILKAYEFEIIHKNRTHESWLNFAEKILDNILPAQNAEGAFPYVFSAEDGSGAEYEGYAGCWCCAAMAYYTLITGNKKYIPSILKANDYYLTFVNKMECYGTPADTYMAVDSEGVLAFIKASRIMHKITGDEKYLDQLRKALHYEFSFKFAYNVPVKVPPLSDYGWSSSGGTVTSVCNPHVHPMSNNVIDDMIYYLENREDKYIRSRLNDTVLWGLQTYNSYDGEFDYGRRGWMTERFCHSEGFLTEKYHDGRKSSIWFAYLPWGASNVLEGICGDLWNYYEDKSDES